MRARRDHPERSALRRRALRTALWLVAVSLLFNAIFGEMGLIRGLRQRSAAARLGSDVDVLVVQNTALLAEIETLKKDSYRIESIAREELGLSHPDEIIFLFPDSPRFENHGADVSLP